MALESQHTTRPQPEDPGASYSCTGKVAKLPKQAQTDNGLTPGQRVKQPRSSQHHPGKPPTSPAPDPPPYEPRHWATSTEPAMPPGWLQEGRDREASVATRDLEPELLSGGRAKQTHAQGGEAGCPGLGSSVEPCLTQGLLQPGCPQESHPSHRPDGGIHRGEFVQ